MSELRPRIAITMGDPAGVGPELCLQLRNCSQVLAQCEPVLYVNSELLERVRQEVDPDSDPLPTAVTGEELAARSAIGSSQPPFSIVDVSTPDAAAIQPGKISAMGGQLSYDCLNLAITHCMEQKVAGIVTAPINKESLASAGIPFPGHTEILASRTKADPIVMMLTSEAITCSLVTAHVGLDEVPGLMNEGRIRETIRLTHEAMTKIRGRKARLVVCGLNPHAGEHGLFGQKEEERFIRPAVEWAKEQGMDVLGPLAPDTAFVPSIRTQTDAYVCMYHDQGLIPLKALAFEESVNTTLGLPIVRTSVDHGTAFDIAWQGKASVKSLIHAIEFALGRLGAEAVLRVLVSDSTS